MTDKSEFEGVLSGGYIYDYLDNVLILRFKDVTWPEQIGAGHYRVTITRVEQEPLCPVCGKPESEHKDRLFCCPFCGGKVAIENEQVVCQWCHIGTILYGFSSMAGSVWNRRALGPASTHSVAATTAGNRGA